MNLPARYHMANLGDLKPKQIEGIQGYIDTLPQQIRDGVGLLLWGNNSSGKTYIAAALCKRVWGQYRVASYFITARDLYTAWIKDRLVSTDSEETVLERASRIRFLVIDDLGREYRTDSKFFESNLGALIRDRTSNLNTTVITTNLSPLQIDEIYGKATSELMKESLPSVRFNFGGMRDRSNK